MQREHAKTIATHALDELAQALDEGYSDALCAYLKAQARFHTYSFGNVLLILAQRPEATQVAGFHAWRKLGRCVRKGEKGIAIFAPIGVRSSRNEAEGEDETEDRSDLRFRVVHVFDIAQTDGEALPEPPSVGGDPGACIDRLRAHITDLGIALEHGPLPPGVHGASHGGRITLRPGLPPAQEFSVAVHELAHELLHQIGERPESKTVRETEAEAAAFVVCRAVGLETNTAASDYIQLYAGSPDTLAQSLERIQRTAAPIIAAVTGETATAPAAALS